MTSRDKAKITEWIVTVLALLAVTGCGLIVLDIL